MKRLKKFLLIWKTGAKIMRTILNILAVLSLTSLIYLGYANRLIQTKFEIPIMGISDTMPMLIVIILIAILGTVLGLCYSLGLYRSQKFKAEAYYRELEKASINNMTGDDKIKVLENKIQVLEKALDDALKNK